jgi:hypothetical protein
MTQKSAPRRKDIVTLADLAPRNRVVGGSERRVFGADIRQEDGMAGPKKAAKDLPASKTVKAGQKVR